MQAGWDGADDSDQIQTHAYRLDGGLSLPGPFDLRLGYAHGDVEGPDASGATIDAQTDSLFGVLGWRPRVNHRGELRLGATKLTDKDDGTREPKSRKEGSRRPRKPRSELPSRTETEITEKSELGSDG